MFLKDVAQSYNHLSFRALNICENLEIFTIQDFFDFITKYQDFSNVRNCGKKTNLELLAFYDFCCKREILKDQSQFVSDKFLENDSKIFEAIVSKEFGKLSIRAQNALTNLFGSNLFFRKNIETYFIRNDFKPLRLRNVGRKTAFEIDNFKSIITQYYNTTFFELDSPVNQARSELYAILGFMVEDEFYLEKFVSNTFPLFKFSQRYFNEILALEKDDTYILKNHFHLLDRLYTLEEMGAKFNLTRERIRQKREKLISRVRSIFSILSPLLKKTEYEDSILKGHFVVFPEQIVNEHLKAEINEVGPVFCIFLIELFIGDDYYSISPMDKLQRPKKIEALEKYRLFHRITESYLVSRHLISKLQLLDFLSSVLFNLTKRHDDVKIHKIDLSSNSNFGNDLLQLFSIILERQFNLKVDDGYYKIERSSNRKVFEYIVETLEAIGKPAHISEIIFKLTAIFPTFIPSETGIKAAIRSNKKLFIHFGRTSTFGLRIWEEKFPNIRGGTIRDIVEEFLGQSEEPCHISVITEYVQKYRKSDKHSVLQNLKLADDGRFIFFKGSHVGLTSKNYIKKDLLVKPDEVHLDSLLKSIFFG